MAYQEIVCPRCNGTDFVPRFSYHDHGHCYKCGGKGTIRVRTMPDGSVDHDHRLAGYQPGVVDPVCFMCGLPSSQWPPVVPAQWWGDEAGWEVFLPPFGRTTFVTGESRRKAQNAARTLIKATFPSARIKWTDHTK